MFCIPHGLNDKHGVGTNNLLKRGAKIVTSAKDIIDSFDYLVYKEKDFKNELNNNLNSDLLEENLLLNKDGEDINNDLFNNKNKIIKKEYEDVYNCLIGPPIKINQICDILNKPINEVNNALFMLELDGLVEKTRYGYQIK